MASRRTISSEKGFIEKGDATAFSPAALEKSNIAPAVPPGVIFKLLAFTFAMVVFPIGSYFATVNTIFRGKMSNSTFAGATAAFIANVVLIGYVIVAMKEDQSERLEAEEEAKKSK
ncbi:vacuolar ATPase assembly integral membrane protein VMA21 [Coniosporium apollinis CBS 100218]|uniref:Vacuolar ATPase assembly integral membrane protein VMA21 n=1 Tax=Coniosporium apollinis (strain CBS 100218) TaxID=1168221 RepID=R7YQH0_CONA1|nr:vacuolar ATPase assembly integral membrane protein VMA21 [Coniosporium apollinis CBS 100218]EON64160.1 vacuolar ATPase assembly integral membrane protein VMA21 [Coniosporium apollinis CBS 100218]